MTAHRRLATLVPPLMDAAETVPEVVSGHDVCVGVHPEAVRVRGQHCLGRGDDALDESRRRIRCVSVMPSISVMI